jgi:hypothetical protein
MPPNRVHIAPLPVAHHTDQLRLFSGWPTRFGIGDEKLHPLLCPGKASNFPK